MRIIAALFPLAFFRLVHAEDDYPSRAWQPQPPKRSKVNTRPFWITVGAILGLVVLVGVIAGVVGANSSDKSASKATDCPSGMYYDDVAQSCTPREPSTTYSAPTSTVPPGHRAADRGHTSAASANFASSSFGHL